MARRRRGRSGAWGRWLLLLVVILAAAALAVRWFPRRPAEVNAYFVRFDNVRHTGTLMPVRRTGPGRVAPLNARIEAALRAVLAGPSPGERRQGLTSEIPPGTTLRGVQMNGTTAVVDLSSDFTAGGGSTSMLARLSQVVYTATQFAQVPEVQILIDGRRVETLGGEGLLIQNPLRRSATPRSF